jgi:hypothetical protein
MQFLMSGENGNMEHKEANFLANTVTSLLGGKKTTSVWSHHGGWNPPHEVRTGQTFEAVYVSCEQDQPPILTVVDSYGVWPGNGKWSFHPNSRSVYVETRNGDGDQLVFSWTMENPDSESWYAFQDASERYYVLKMDLIKEKTMGMDQAKR